MRPRSIIPALALAGCAAAPPDSTDEIGEVIASITTVPGDVNCARFTLSGATVSTKNYALTPSGAAAVNLGALAPGLTQIRAGAYTQVCGSVTATTAAAWVGDAVEVDVRAGLTTEFAMTFRPATPVTGNVDFARPAVAVAAGSGFAVALLHDGTARAWGWNSAGQLGNGASGTLERRPVTVAGLASARQIAAGSSHACALLADGSARCWGDNLRGQIGDGTNLLRAAPAAVVMPPGVTFQQIAAGGDETCAIGSDTRVYCWGRNDYGQIGDGTGYNRNLPTPIAGAVTTEFASVTVGFEHACALWRSGQLYCWGANFNGEHGKGVTGGGPLPAATGYFPVAGASLGSASSCAITPAGGVACAGSNYGGALGDGTTVTRSTVAPALLGGVAIQLAVGTYFACAVRDGGDAYCWGRNTLGQLGDGTATDRPVPVQVRSLGGATQVSTGSSFACARKGDGSVWCWGSNQLGQIGDGGVLSAFVPRRVAL